MEIKIDVNGISISKKKQVTTRPLKGKSLLEIAKNYTIIDIETTDFSAFYGDIIEVAAIKIRDNKVVDKFSSLVSIDYEVPEHISDKTNITTDMLLGANSKKDALSALLDLINDDIVIGHNVNFDINFIYDECLEVGLQPITNDFIDTMRIAKYAVKNLPSYSLRNLAKHFKIEVEVAHRALNDCKTTLNLYLELYSLVSSDSKLLEIAKKIKVDLRKIVTAGTEVDENNRFYKKNICFTGKMDMLTKAEAAQVVANLGGINQNNVTKDTNILVLGNLEYQREQFGDKSSKHKKAESLQQNGLETEILTEHDFLDLVKQ